MKRNRVSVAMLTALALCGVVQNSSHAQGGVLLPEPTTAPVVRVVPNVVEYPAKKVVRTAAAMPTPRGATPMKATGRIVHMQQVTNGVFASGPALSPSLEPMSMGGFASPRPLQRPLPGTMSEPSLVMPGK
ncbi:hypothetical protein BH10CYA1_BH10CYA1_64660 [soil metagenome]